MPERFEFASPGWMRALFDAIEKRSAAAQQELQGVEYSACEVFTDVPEHLAKDASRRLAWHFRIRDGKAVCQEGEIDDANWKITGDYATLVPLARLELGSDPEAAQALAEAKIAENVAAGKMKLEGSREGRPAFLEGLHDAMVKVTA